MFFKNLWNNRRSIIISWLMSYLIILFLPIVIGIVIYIESISIIDKEVTRANLAILKQVQQAMDSRIKDVKQMGLQIAWNERIQGFIYTQGLLESQHYYTINGIVEDLRTQKSANDFVGNCYVYLRNTDTVITPTAHYDAKTIYETMHKSQDMTFVQWTQFIQSQHLQEFTPLTIRKDNGTLSKVIAYVQSIPFEKPYKPLATVLITIDESNLQEVITNTHWLNQGTILILDKNNRILASTHSDELSEAIKYENLTESQGTLDDYINKENIKVSYITSQVTEWKYVSVTPTRIFMERAVYIRSLTLITLVLCIILGGILVYIFAKRNYNPIRSLIKTIGVPFNSQYDEFHFIQKAITSTKDEKDQMEKKIHQQNFALSSNFLMRLLKGSLSENIPMDDMLSSFDIQFCSDKFAVILFYIEDYEGLFRGDSSISMKDKFELVQFIIKNVVEELVGENHLGFTVEVDHLEACLVNLRSGDSDNYKEQMIEISKQTQQFIREKFQVHLSIAMSEVQKDVSGIHKAYQQALEAMEYRMIIGNRNIIHYDDIKSQKFNKESFYYYPLEVEQQLVNCIKAGELDKSWEIINDVFQKNFLSVSTPIYVVKCLKNDIVSTLIKVLGEIDGAYENSFLEGANPIEKLLKLGTLEESKNQMFETLREVCQYVQLHQKDPNIHLRDEIMEFVNNNYSNMDLSVSMVADHLNMNLSYISKFFKKQTAEGLLDYINKIRLNKAKDLMDGQKRSIADIASQVGYYDSNAFIRAFKKYEGVTPGKYKESK